MLWLSKQLALAHILSHFRIETAQPRDDLGYVSHVSDHYTFTERGARIEHIKRFPHRRLRGEMRATRYAR